MISRKLVGAVVQGRSINKFNLTVVGCDDDDHDDDDENHDDASDDDDDEDPSGTGECVDGDGDDNSSFLT